MSFTNSKDGTISHLLYKPKNLRRMIHSAHPDWPEQSYRVCMPVPCLIISVKEGHDNVIKNISQIAQEHYGVALSNRIYAFSNDDFTGEVVCQLGQREPTIINLEDRIPDLVLPDRALWGWHLSALFQL